jgi:phage tail-like protein
MGYYPPVGFHFRVEFGLPGLSSVANEANFQEVSGLDATVGVETVKEGGELRYVHRLPNTPEYPNLVLKRGMLIGSALIAWFQTGLEYFIFKPVPVTVSLLNGDHIPIASWIFMNAYPVKWSVSGLNSTENGVAVESIELAYDYFRRL